MPCGWRVCGQRRLEIHPTGERAVISGRARCWPHQKACVHFRKVFERRKKPERETSQEEFQPGEIWSSSWPDDLSADVHGAKAENYVAAGSGTAEAQHGAEAREEQHLIELAAQLRIARTRKNLIVGHLPMRINDDVQEKSVGKRKFKIILFRSPGLRVVRKGDELGGAHQIKSHVVLHGAYSDARCNHLENQNKNDDGREKSTGGRNGERAENVIEQDLGAIL